MTLGLVLTPPLALERCRTICHLAGHSHRSWTLIGSLDRIGDVQVEIRAASLLVVLLLSPSAWASACIQSSSSARCCPCCLPRHAATEKSQIKQASCQSNDQVRIYARTADARASWLPSEPKTCSEIANLPQLAPTPDRAHLRDGRFARLSVVELGSSPGSCLVNPASQAHYGSFADHPSLSLRI